MYKARLSQWGFSKNYSDRDYQICAVLREIRLKAGKSRTGFIVHGHLRSLKDLHKYIKGRKLSEAEFLATASGNILCKSQAEQESDPQYAHVRAYTPEPDQDLEEPSHNIPTKRHYSSSEEVLRITAKTSLAGLEPVSEVSSCPTSAHRNSFAVQILPHDDPAQAAWSPVAAQLTPATPHTPVSPLSQRESTVSGTWHYQTSSPPSAPVELATSRPRYGGSLASAYSYNNDAMLSPAPQSQYAVSSQSKDSPAVPCQQLQREVEYMALQMVDTPSLKSLCGHDDIDSWRLMHNDSSTPGSEDYDQVCSTCHNFTRYHFISLPNLESPQQSRSILNDTADSNQNAMQIPGSSRAHNHSWRWVARCFSACIYFNRGDHVLAGKSLADADEEFERMLIPQQDPKVILALNQTLSILHVHNEGETTRTIMKSAHNVAAKILGPDDPISILVRWMVLVADLQHLNGEIPSDTLFHVHQQLVARHGYTDARSIGALYCYAFMLNSEDKIEQAEHYLTETYTVSCSVLGPKHLQSISAATNLHRALKKQNRTSEAIQVLRQAIQDSRETLGASHPRRLESKRLLALMLQEREEWDEVERLYWQVLEGRIKMYGKRHSYTLGMKVDLEALLKKLGKWGTETPRSEDEYMEGGENGKDQNIEGKGKANITLSDNMDIDMKQTREQLRLQDLFEWGPNERWNDDSRHGRRSRDRSNTIESNMTTDAFMTSTNSPLNLRNQNDISNDWVTIAEDDTSLRSGSDSGRSHEAF